MTKCKQIVLASILFVVLLITGEIRDHLKWFPEFILRYGDSDGMTVTLFDLNNPNREPFTLSSEAFFCVSGEDSVPEDQHARQLPLKELGLHLWDFDAQYRMVFQKNGKLFGYGYISHVDKEKVNEKANRVHDGGKFFYPRDGEYYAYRYDFRTYVISKRQGEQLAEILKGWR